MEFRAFHIIGIIALFQSIFLGFVLASTKKGNRLANRLFAALLFTFSLLITYSCTHSIGMGLRFVGFHKYFFIIAQTGFLVGPLLYFYFRAILDKSFRLLKRHLLHLLPLVIAAVYFGIRATAYELYNPWQSPLKGIYGAAILLHEICYIGLTVIFLNRHNVALKRLFKADDKAKTAWFRVFILGFILIWHLKLQSFVLLDVWRRWRFCPYGESLYFLTMFLFLTALLYLALKHPELIQNFRKYSRSDLGSDDIAKVRNRLQDYMTSEKPYLDPSLSLPVLAKRIHISKGHLSQVVNTSFNQNFCDFINAYRIEESKRLLSGNPDAAETILEIAYRVGFNSKSAFNRAFKKHTDLTPKEFKANGS